MFFSCLKYSALHFFKIYEIIGFPQQSLAKIFRDPCAFLPDLLHFLSPKEKDLGYFRYSSQHPSKDKLKN